MHAQVYKAEPMTQRQLYTLQKTQCKSVMTLLIDRDSFQTQAHTGTILTSFITSYCINYTEYVRVFHLEPDVPQIHEHLGETSFCLNDCDDFRQQVCVYAVGFINLNLKLLQKWIMQEDCIHSAVNTTWSFNHLI